MVYLTACKSYIVRDLAGVGGKEVRGVGSGGRELCGLFSGESTQAWKEDDQRWWGQLICGS
jgi:hypothetical protein